jgi:nucleoside-diphosphate-sugar epimerase
MKKTALICGAGGFIGSHLAKRLSSEGYNVYGIDLKYPEFSPTACDYFFIGDLRSQKVCKDLFKSIPSQIDELYQLACLMGGAGFIFTGENDADVMHSSALINLNIVDMAVKYHVKKLFYSSSACVYPEYNQINESMPVTSEASAYPAQPDSEYGWEKLFSERLYMAYHRNCNLNVRIARFHNIFGAEGSWNNGKEKSPAAICRKVAMADDGGSIEIWGKGTQTRSFLHIYECLLGVGKLMKSNYTKPLNIGSEEMISINDLAEMVIAISGKKISINNIWGEEFEKKYGHRCPVGVNGRKSDNTLIQEVLNWKPCLPLIQGMTELYKWINSQLK